MGVSTFKGVSCFACLSNVTVSIFKLRCLNHSHLMWLLIQLGLICHLAVFYLSHWFFIPLCHVSSFFRLNFLKIILSYSFYWLMGCNSLLFNFSGCFRLYNIHFKFITDYLQVIFYCFICNISTLNSTKVLLPEALLLMFLVQVCWW